MVLTYTEQKRNREVMKGVFMNGKKGPQIFNCGKYEIRVTGKLLNGLSLAMIHEINFENGESEIKRALKDLGYHHVKIDGNVISFVSR